MEKPNAVPLDLEAISAYAKDSRYDVPGLARNYLCDLILEVERLRAPQPNAGLSPLGEAWNLLAQAMHVLNGPDMAVGQKAYLQLQALLERSHAIVQAAMLPLGSGVQGDQPAKNRYGVDCEYFRKELAALSASLNDRPGGELALYLLRLAEAACPGVEVVGEEVEIQKDEPLDPRYGNPLNFTLSNKPCQVEIDGIKHQVPLDVWRVLGQILHLSVERQRKINALIQERHISPGVSIPALLEVYQNAVRHALRVLDDGDATRVQQFVASAAEVQACQDILDAFSALQRELRRKTLALHDIANADGDDIDKIAEDCTRIAGQALQPGEYDDPDAYFRDKIKELEGQLSRLREALESIIIRCREGDKRSNWLPTIEDIATRAIAPPGPVSPEAGK